MTITSGCGRVVLLPHPHQRFLEHIGMQSIRETLAMRRISRRIWHVDEMNPPFEGAAPSMVQIAVDHGQGHPDAVRARPYGELRKPEGIVDT